MLTGLSSVFDIINMCSYREGCGVAKRLGLKHGKVPMRKPVFGKTKSNNQASNLKSNGEITANDR